MYLTKEDLRQSIGSLLTIGFEGTEISAELLEIMREIHPAGLIFFSRNCESPEQVQALGHELKMLRPEKPLVLSVDQEGGRVARIGPPATRWPAMLNLGEYDDLKLTQQVAYCLAQELRAMNFDINYAPVLDVNTNPKNPIIGDRSFGATPTLVAKHGAAFIKSMHAAGIGACAKHFPGHGDTDIDSHLALPSVEHEIERLREIEWPPFAAAIDAQVGAIMTAHIVTHCLDPHTPATLSRAVLTCLRQELGFGGCIVSDDLTMKAISDHFKIHDVGCLGLQAGIDHFLFCQDPSAMLEFFRGIIHAVEQNKVSHQTIFDAAQRSAKWNDSHYQPPVDPKTINMVGRTDFEQLVAQYC